MNLGRQCWWPGGSGWGRGVVAVRLPSASLLPLHLFASGSLRPLLSSQDPGWRRVRGRPARGSVRIRYGMFAICPCMRGGRWVGRDGKGRGAGAAAAALVLSAGNIGMPGAAIRRRPANRNRRGAVPVPVRRRGWRGSAQQSDGLYRQAESATDAYNLARGSRRAQRSRSSTIARAVVKAGQGDDRAQRERAGAHGPGPVPRRRYADEARLLLGDIPAASSTASPSRARARRRPAD